MTWGLKPPASLADHATIELRRITDVLQVDHASLFLRDPAHPHRAVPVAERRFTTKIAGSGVGFGATGGTFSTALCNAGTEIFGLYQALS